MKDSTNAKTSVTIMGDQDTLTLEFMAILASVEEAQPDLIGDALAMMALGSINKVTRV